MNGEGNAPDADDWHDLSADRLPADLPLPPVVEALRLAYIELCSPVGDVVEGLCWCDALDGFSERKRFRRFLVANVVDTGFDEVPRAAIVLPLFVLAAGIFLRTPALLLLAAILALPLLLVVWRITVKQSGLRGVRAACRDWRRLASSLERIGADLEKLPPSLFRDAAGERARAVASTGRAHRSLLDADAGLQPGTGPLGGLLARIGSAVAVSGESVVPARCGDRSQPHWPQSVLGPVPADDRADLLSQDSLDLHFDSNNSRTAWMVTDSLGRIVGSVHTSVLPVREPVGCRRSDPDAYVPPPGWYERQFWLCDASLCRVVGIQAAQASGGPRVRHQTIIDERGHLLGTATDRLADEHGQPVATCLGSSYRDGATVLATCSTDEGVLSLTLGIEANHKQRLLILADWIKDPQPWVEPDEPPDSLTGYP